MKYWFKNVADNIYIYPKSASRNLILQTRTSDCNSALGSWTYSKGNSKNQVISLINHNENNNYVNFYKKSKGNN